MSDERARWRAAGIAVLGLSVLALVIGLNPANFPESWVKQWLESQLPYGSSIVAVRQAIDDHDWETVKDRVFENDSFVLVHIGNSWVPPRYVYVFFGFDRFGRLISIHVTKERNPVSGESVPVD